MVKHADLFCLPAAGSQLPAPWPLPPGVQSKRLAAQPGVGGKPRRRGRLSEIKAGARNSPPVKTRVQRLRPGVETSTGGGEGCQKSTQGPEIRLQSKLLSGGSGPPLTQARAAGKVARNHNRDSFLTFLLFPEQGGRQGSCIPRRMRTARFSYSNN